MIVLVVFVLFVLLLLLLLVGTTFLFFDLCKIHKNL